jgi:surface polysaccharide O-acyltransferase-like enzyme
MPNSQNKIEYPFIYYLRIFACLCILIKHIAGSAVDYFWNPSIYDSFARIILLSINNILWFAVNLFFMITGYIYLSDEKECTYKTLFKNILRLFLYLLVFGLLFSILLEVIGGRRLYSLNDLVRLLHERPLSLDMFARSIKNVLAGKNQWGHMWFMYEIIKVYLILPILKSFTKENKYGIYILTAILIAFNYILPELGRYTGIHVYNFFPAGVYLFMVLLGGLVSKIINKIRPMHQVISFILFIIIISYYFYQNIINSSVRIIGTSTPMTIILAVLIFISFAGIKTSNYFIALISRATLLIYLLHPMVIHIFYGILKLNPLKYNLILSIPLTTLCIFISTLIIAFIIEFALGKLHLVFAIKNQVE